MSHLGRTAILDVQLNGGRARDRLDDSTKRFAPAQSPVDRCLTLGNQKQRFDADRHCSSGYGG